MQMILIIIKKAYAGKKSGITDFATDTIDKQTEEYERFNTRRNQENTVTVISDMLILQTSSGDQSVVYFDTDQTKTAQRILTILMLHFQRCGQIIVIVILIGQRIQLMLDPIMENTTILLQVCGNR